MTSWLPSIRKKRPRRQKRPCLRGGTIFDRGGGLGRVRHGAVRRKERRIKESEMNNGHVWEPFVALGRWPFEELKNPLGARGWFIGRVREECED